MQIQQPIQVARLLRRYKRFLADVQFENGEIITAHIANTGSMESCLFPGQKAMLSFHDSPTRKLKWSVLALEVNNAWIGVHTPHANHLAHEGILDGVISELSGYNSITSESTYAQSRFDFFLQDHPSQPDCYVEIKNVTLLGPDQVALFPDSRSERGQKHLKELSLAKKDGFRAAMLYIVQRSEPYYFTPAIDHDPEYTRLLEHAFDQGVEVYVYGVEINPPQWKVTKPLPWFFLSENGEVRSPYVM
jgi:sugar fermentation stimulation protein A